MSRPVRVGITHGDYNGVGYEVILKALANEMITELFTPVVFGNSRLFNKARKDFGHDEASFVNVSSASAAQDGAINVVNVMTSDPELTPGQPTEASGKAAVEALEAAVDALRAGEIDVLVTAPICKANANSEAFPFPGHTEFLQARAGDGSEAMMILFDDYLRIALATTHLPVSEVAGAVTQERVYDTITRLDMTLRRDFAIERPKIAVLALNPHAGDAGLLGKEEQEVIAPILRRCKDEGLLAFGPYPADGFFGAGLYTKFDGIVAMYHDQGLAPFKALAREKGVNFTAGLPFIRTSPDHGTAFDIAWKGEADPTSMREAIYKATDIFRNRRNYMAAALNPLPRSAKSNPRKDREQQGAPVAE